jgi:hypothetical protein
MSKPDGMHLEEKSGAVGSSVGSGGEAVGGVARP